MPDSRAGGRARRLIVAGMAWARRVKLGDKAALVLTLAAAAAGVATYAGFTQDAALTGQDSGPEPGTLFLLLQLDLVLLLLLVLVIAQRLVRLWLARRQRRAGAGLHMRLVLVFSLLAVMPAIAVAVLSAIFVHGGLQSWFNERIATAVQESEAVAEAYLAEHQQVIRGDVLAMANDLNREADALSESRRALQRFVTSQAAVRDLTDALVFSGDGQVVARSRFARELELGSIPADALTTAQQGEVALLTDETRNYVRALVQIAALGDYYLYVGRRLDPDVLNHMESAQGAVAQYEQLRSNQNQILLTFSLIFGLAALLLLLSAVWLGLTIANRFVGPLTGLVSAAERVRAGDLTARVADAGRQDEIGDLARAFNRMTEQLGSQHSELVEANRQLDLRRIFTETVLSGVSAGVVGLDPDGRVTLPNRSAAEMLGCEREAMLARPLAEIAPEIAELLPGADRRGERVAEARLTLTREGQERDLLVRVATERVEGELHGYVVTFDDVTDLLTAQRKAAWADVARRVAHEIKNPLTPLQLAADRLRRRYGDRLSDDDGTFDRLLGTINHRVSDIERLVSEFARFARLPAPEKAPVDLGALVRSVVQEHRGDDAGIDLDLPETAVVVPADDRQIGQVLTNLIQNATTAAAQTGQAGGGGGGAFRQAVPGEAARGAQVAVRLRVGDEEAAIDVVDTGPGLPADVVGRLFDPYVTLRQGGTGLGLAIAAQIVEDHGGRIDLRQRQAYDGRTGAWASVRLPLDASARRAGPLPASPAAE